MKRIIILPSFERSVKKLTRQDKFNLAESLESFNLFLLSGELPVGFGFKKINHDKYEFRVDIRLRVIVDTVKSFMKNKHGREWKYERFPSPCGRGKGRGR